MTRGAEHPSANAVRPGASTPRSLLAGLLAQLRNLVGGDRSELLYRALANEIRNIHEFQNQPLTLLDYGCGMMGFSSRLMREDVVANFVGMDMFPTPASDDPIWQHYRQIPPAGISSVDQRFDLAIVTDMLHHADEADRAPILRHLASICRVVLVKDHFEYGFFSRQVLRLADWYGNYAYGVNVPDRYFDVPMWENLVREAGLTEVKRTPNVRVHRGLFGLILAARHHFIALLKAA